MRRPLKFGLTFIAIIASLVVIRLKFWVVWDQNSVLRYLRSTADHGVDDFPLDTPTTDKIIVMAKTRTDITDWAEDYLPE